MEGLRKVAALALASGALALGGCVTPDANKPESKKPDVTRPGVLPPPQNMVKPVTDPAADGAVVPAGGIQPAGANGAVISAAQPPAPAARAAAAPSLSKLTARFEKKVPARELGVGWRNRVAHLPDPARNGAPSPGLVGQLFLFGGPKMEFVDADGTLTVDLIDETPRPAGQRPATAERWQFNRELLLKMRTTDETFGKSYVLFLPWPAYKSDITKVRISARYDQESGDTLYAAPSVVTLDAATPHGAPLWDGTTRTFSAAPGASGTLPPGALPLARPLSETFGTHSGAPPGLVGAIPLGGPLPGAPREPVRSVNLTPPAPEPGPPPTLPAVGTVSPGLGPVPPPLPPGVEPLAITIGRP